MLFQSITVINDDFFLEVTAFAAENRETEIFFRLFQAGTNLFLNGNLFCTLYLGGLSISIVQLTSSNLMVFLWQPDSSQYIYIYQLSLLFGMYRKYIYTKMSTLKYMCVIYT